MIGFRRCTAAWITAALLVFQAGAAAQGTGQPAATAFSPTQIEQMVAPIALYPDALVAQILMASTYPMQVIQAARWVEKNPSLKGQALDDAAAQQDWDPSVKSLVQFPDVLKRMNDNLDWTQDLGDAVLGQQTEVMDAVQRMRKLAHESGNLKTTSEQKVIVEEKIIRVEPSTQVVYVPAYNPTVVYGTAWAPTTTITPSIPNHPAIGTRRDTPPPTSSPLA